MSSPRPPEEAALNEAASVWMHRGMDLAATGDPGVLDEAVHCFDEAIALRRTLPLNEVPFYRYGLSAGWINRADALARQDGAALDEALRSYGEALALLETLAPEENPLYPRRLAITRLNHGVALQKRDGPGDAAQAAGALRQALDVLARFPGVADGAALQAAAWGNLAGTLAGQGRESADAARAAARSALGLTKPAEDSDPVAAGTALAARHALARLLVRDLADGPPSDPALVAEATDAVEEALALVRRWGGQPGFAAREGELVRFGCRIYAAAQPRFLAEFVAEHVGGVADRETLAAARTALWAALERLQAEGFGPSLLTEVQELKDAQARLS